MAALYAFVFALRGGGASVYFAASVCHRPKRSLSRLLVYYPLCLAAIVIFSSGPVHPQTVPTAVLLSVNAPVEHTLAFGIKDPFELELATGQYIRIAIDQDGTDVDSSLFAPDNTKIGSFDNEVRPAEKEIVEFVAERPGKYRFEVNMKYRSGPVKYRIALIESRPASDKEKVLNEARVLIWRSLDLERLGKYDDAVSAADRARDLAEKTLDPDDAFVGLTLTQLGWVMRQTGDLRKARSVLERAIAVNSKALGVDHPQTADSKNSLAMVSRLGSDFGKAEQLMKEVLASTEKILGPEGGRMVAHLINLSTIYTDMGDDAPVEPLLLRAISIADKRLETNHRAKGVILNNLGLLYTHQGKLDAAQTALERALVIYEKSAGIDSPLYSNTLQNLGIVARQKKDFTRAMAIYQQALAIREKTLGPDHPFIAPLLNNISNIYRAQGDLTKALEVQRRVLEIAQKGVGRYSGMALTSLNNSARIYAALDDMPNALKFQAESNAINETALALTLATGSERQKLAVIDTLGENTDRTISLNLRQAPGNSTAAALGLASILSKKGRVPDAMADALAHLRSRLSGADQVLLDKLKGVTTDLAKISLNKPAAMSSDEYQARLSSLAAEKEKIEFDIGSRNAEFNVQLRPATVNAVAAEIPSGAVLAEFAVYLPFDPKVESSDAAYGEPRYAVFLLDRGRRVESFDIGDARLVEKAVEGFRDSLRNPESRDVERAARSLDELIMRPIRRFIGDRTQLLISPDGELNLIPFEALRDETGKYLVERYSISYLTSGRDLLRIGTAIETRGPPLVIADPAFGETAAASAVPPPAAVNRPSKTARKISLTSAPAVSDMYFAPLAGTAGEARSILGMFPDARLLTGSDATETALKAVSAPRILHIATHGFFLAPAAAADPKKAVAKDDGFQNPLLRSGLAMAGANRHSNDADDGVLTALEAAGLDLWGTKLVVLSACDTGLGEVRNGDGVYGLRRSFVLAGTQTLVMSLWPVSDYVTRQTMTGYYRNLKLGLGRGEALRRVRLEMLKHPNRRHPFYWASFIQSGEWSALEPVH